MFYRAVVGFASVQTALTLFGKTVITFSSGIRLVHRLLIMKLDSYTFETMYGLCLNYFQRIAVFNLKLGKNLFWGIFSKFWVCVEVVSKLLQSSENSEFLI